MFIPPQGFRHAAALLLTNRVRAIPHDASPHLIADALARLADELVALAADTRVSAEAKDWLRDEYGRAIDRLPHAFDVAAAKAHAGLVIARVSAGTRETERRDLFLVYVPEDRLPLAAPLAIELTKRRVSVAFSEYEVGSQEELATAVEHGMANHGAGVLLQTLGFERAGLRLAPPLPDRLTILNRPEEPSTAGDLAGLAARLTATIVKNLDKIGR